LRQRIVRKLRIDQRRLGILALQPVGDDDDLPALRRYQIRNDPAFGSRGEKSGAVGIKAAKPGERECSLGQCSLGQCSLGRCSACQENPPRTDFSTYSNPPLMAGRIDVLCRDVDLRERRDQTTPSGRTRWPATAPGHASVTGWPSSTLTMPQCGGPARQPQHLALERPEGGKSAR